MEKSACGSFLKVILLVLVYLSVSVSAAPSALAATTPSLGAAATYAVLGSTFTNTSAGTTINGDIGFTTGPAVTPGGIHPNYGPLPPYAAAGADQGTALSSLTSQPCTFTFGGGAINLSTDTSHGPVGTYTPGVYCSSGAMDIGGALILNGNGTYIFRTSGAITSTAGAIVSLVGSCANDVFWVPTQAVTFAANTRFVGTVISNAGVTVGAGTTWIGRSLAFGGTVTADTNIINLPTCAAAPAAVSFSSSSLPSSSSSLSPSSSSSATISGSSVFSSSSRSSGIVLQAATARRTRVATRIAQNRITVSAVATAEVPLLPNAGIGPDATHTPLAIALFGFLIALLGVFALRQTQRLSVREDA